MHRQNQPHKLLLLALRIRPRRSSLAFMLVFIGFISSHSYGDANIEPAKDAAGNPLHVFRCVTFSGDSKLVAIGLDVPQGGDERPESPRALVYDIDRRAEIATLLAPIASPQAVAFAPDGRSIAAAATKVAVWSIDSKRLIGVLSGCTDAVTRLRYSPNGNLLAAQANETVVWETATTKQLAVIPEAGPTAFFPDGRALAVEATNGGIAVYTAPTFGRSAIIERGSDDGRGVNPMSSDGGRILRQQVNPQVDVEVEVWETKTPKRVAKLAGTNLNSPQLSPDGKIAVTRGREGLQLWSAVTGALLKTIPGEHNPVFVRFSPDSKLILISRGEVLDLWKCPSAEQVGTARGQGVREEDVAFSTDSKFFATVGTDATTDDRTKSYVRLWDTATAKELTSVPCDDAEQIAFSPDLSRCAMLLRNTVVCKVIELRK